MTIEEDFALLRSLSSTAAAAVSRIEEEMNYRFRAQDELRNGLFRFDELTKERDALKLVLSDVVMLLQGLVVTANRRIAQLPEEK